MSTLISALRANGILQANASSNIANMNTTNYKAIETNIVPSTADTVDITTARSDEAASLDENGNMESNVDVAKEFVDMTRAKTGFEAALHAISTRENMLDDLMNTLSKK
jgi:flagellar hook protein FlgE